jgi:hypothetical protein
MALPDEIERILDDDLLYHRVHEDFIDPERPDVVVPDAIKPEGDGLSMDWAKKCTPEETRQRAKTRSVSEYGVIGILASNIRSNTDLKIEYRPTPENPAHVLVNAAWQIENKSQESKRTRRKLRTILARYAIWMIFPGRIASENP